MSRTFEPLTGAGVGLKPRHIPNVLEDSGAAGWFEVHAENYMGAGGPPHHWLARVRDRFPISIHGVGLSIGNADGIDTAHLDRLKTVVDRYEPSSVSEHLAWSTHQGQFFNDLLALPYNNQTLTLISDHIDRVQNHLGRKILIENPSTYVTFDESDMDEAGFIREALRRSGAGLLLDVNNVHVTCVNHGLDAHAYLDALPLDRVEEIHLAGHGQDRDDDGAVLLIDAHDRPVADAVWVLYERALEKTGPVATLIEWDNDLPDWDVLSAEAEKARSRLARCATGEARHVA